MTETRRGVELRAEPGRRLVGVVMRYGADGAGDACRTVGPWWRSFASVRLYGLSASDGETRRQSCMHDPSLTLATTTGARGRGNLALIDGARDALRMVAVRCQAVTAFDAALALVADKSTAETSVEFRAVSDRIENGRRTVLKSTLPWYRHR